MLLTANNVAVPAGPALGAIDCRTVCATNPHHANRHNGCGIRIAAGQAFRPGVIIIRAVITIRLWPGIRQIWLHGIAFRC